MTANRIVTHLDPTAPPIPADYSRQWSAAVFAAVTALQNQLSHPNAAVARNAANSILDLEKTRLRHDRPLAGTAVECGPHTPCAGLKEPHTAYADHTPEHESDPEAEAALARVSAYVDAVERGEINLPDDLDDEYDDEEEEAPAEEPPPPPPPLSLAERFIALQEAVLARKRAEEGGQPS